MSSAWVTPEQAEDIVRTPVSADQIAAAMPVIEIYSGVTLEVESQLKPRDLRLLKQATAFQAVWMAANIDVLTRMDADDVDQDGIEYSKGDVDAHILGPLAKLALSRLSWRRSRSLQPLTALEDARKRGYFPPGSVTGNEEWLDDYQRWTPL